MNIVYDHLRTALATIYCGLIHPQRQLRGYSEDYSIKPNSAPQRGKNPSRIEKVASIKNHQQGQRNW